MPEPDLVYRNALQHGRSRLEELHRGKRRAVHKLLREREQQPVRLRVDLRQSSRGLCEERERLPPFPPRQLPGESQKASSLRRMNVRKQRRPLLEIRPRVRPAGGCQRLRKLQEGASVLAAQRLEYVRRDAKAVRSEVI